MEKETSIKIEREYIIPLRKKYRIVPRYKRANKAIKTIKEFLLRHMKIRDGDLKKIKIDKYLNEIIWKRGIRNPPHKIKVKAVKEGENVIVTAVTLPEKIKFKKLRHERREKLAEEIKEKNKSLMQKAKETKKSSSEEQKETEEQKIEEKEKIAALKEAGNKLEKTKARELKHSTKEKIKKSSRPMRKVMNK